MDLPCYLIQFSPKTRDLCHNPSFSSAVLRKKRDIPSSNTAGTLTDPLQVVLVPHTSHYFFYILFYAAQWNPTLASPNPYSSPDNHHHEPHHDTVMSYTVSTQKKKKDKETSKFLVPTSILLHNCSKSHFNYHQKQETTTPSYIRLPTLFLTTTNAPISLTPHFHVPLL